MYYDPLNPSDAVLEQGDTTLGYAICAAAVVLLGVGAIVTIRLRRKEEMTNVE